MSRYADPRRCPDCLGAIARGAPVCPHCGLPLRGQVAQELFLTLSRADDLLHTLRDPRTAGAPAAPAPAGPAPVPPVPVPPPPAGRPATHPVASAGPRLSAASVPRILLTLGAACLLVAALVFLAVAWQALGVAGRTVTLVAFTAVATALTGWVARRGLRAATEALALVSLGLLVLDLVGARHAGWLAVLSTTGFLVLAGAVLALASCAGALGVRRTAAARLTGAEVAAALGIGVVAAGIVGGDRLSSAAAFVIAVLVSAAATAGATRLRLRVAAVGCAVVTATSWLFLAGTGLERLGAEPTVDRLWGRLDVWPLLVAAALVAAPALLRTVPMPLRVAAASLGYALVALAALGPALDEAATPVSLAMLAALGVTAVAVRLLPAPWGLVGGLTQAVGGVAAAGLAVQLVADAARRLAVTVGEPWTGSAGDRLPPVDPTLPSPWVLPLAVLVLAATVLSGGRAAAVLAAATRRLHDVRLGTGLVVATATATLALYPVAVGAPVLLLAAAGMAAGAAWWRTGHPGWLASATLATALGTAAALVSTPLTAALLAEVLALAVLVHLRGRQPGAATAAGLVLALAVAGEAWTVGALVGGSRTVVALAALLVLALLCLGGSLVPAAWWATPAAPARTGTEAGAAAAALPVAAAGVLAAPAAATATWTAVYLTVAGAAVVAMALLRPDRRLLGWPGGALLVLASWVRLADLGVSAPEAYTLPTAAALLVLGLVRLHRHRRSGTLPALSAGLALALAPSLLWVLAQPVAGSGGVRALLLGTACFGLVLLGVRLRWSAPLVWGAAVGLLEVLRLAAPYLGTAVPRWVLIGVAGAVLVALGVSWERRLAEARHFAGYVRHLR